MKPTPTNAFICGFLFHMGVHMYRQDSMGLDELREGYGKLMQHIYSPEHYYKRAMTFLREYKRPKVRTPLEFHRLLAVLRSSIRLGIFGKERFQYWKILSWTLFRRPQFITLAITLAIYGHHFRKICKMKIVQ